MMRLVQIRKLDHLVYEVRYQDQEYRFRISSESTIEQLWDELEKLDRLAEVIDD